jgi:hypothetical protein
MIASFPQLMNRAYRLSTFLLQPPKQQEAMTKNFKYHSPEYRATKTHTSLQQSELASSVSLLTSGSEILSYADNCLIFY